MLLNFSDLSETLGFKSQVVVATDCLDVEASTDILLVIRRHEYLNIQHSCRDTSIISGWGYRYPITNNIED
ncbi:hypothetical protein M8J77_021416 [Diaphorina citri]|nr:hypothetical protein M8J77_021416 [Diaphorina citri]